MTRVDVINGDITRVAVDVLMTVVDSSGALSSIDSAIQQRAGNDFHAQTTGRRADGELIFATGAPHRGLFASVLFVVDDHHRSLSELVPKGLREIDRRRLRTVSLPAVGLGTITVQDPAVEAALEAMSQGIHEFIASAPQHLTDIKVVVDDEPAVVQYFKDALQIG